MISELLKLPSAFLKATQFSAKESLLVRAQARLSIIQKAEENGKAHLQSLLLLFEGIQTLSLCFHLGFNFVKYSLVFASCFLPFGAIFLQEGDATVEGERYGWWCSWSASTIPLRDDFLCVLEESDVVLL